MGEAAGAEAGSAGGEEAEAGEPVDEAAKRSAQPPTKPAQARKANAQKQSSHEPPAQSTGPFSQRKYRARLGLTCTKDSAIVRPARHRLGVACIGNWE